MGNINSTNIIGQKFGNLTVIKRTGVMNFKSGQRHSVWLFRCDCGKLLESRLNSVKRRVHKCCGKCSKKFTKTVLSYGESSLKALYDSYIRRAKYANLEFSIDISHFKEITSMNCHYCGIEPLQKKFANKSSYGHYLYNGLDRVNSDIGYTLDNIVPCCKQCNFSKRTHTYEEFYSWVKRVYDHLNTTTKKQ